MIGPEQFIPKTSPEGLDLGPGEIHLWLVDLAPDASVVRTLGTWLEDEEKHRAERFRFEVHRRRFIVRRGRLRQLLAAYQGLEPAAVRFEYGEKGKPALSESQKDHRPLEFNLTDSEDLALIAFTRDLEIGADIEVLRPMPDAHSIAKSFFAAGEREALADVSEPETARAFFHCWTRKEAYIKAIGEGLSEPLDRFEATLFPAEPCHFLHIGGSEAEAKRWALIHLEPTPDSVGAVAYRGTTLRFTGCFGLS